MDRLNEEFKGVYDRARNGWSLRESGFAGDVRISFENSRGVPEAASNFLFMGGTPDREGFLLDLKNAAMDGEKAVLATLRKDTKLWWTTEKKVAGTYVFKYEDRNGNVNYCTVYLPKDEAAGSKATGVTVSLTNADGISSSLGNISDDAIALRNAVKKAFPAGPDAVIDALEVHTRYSIDWKVKRSAQTFLQLSGRDAMGNEKILTVRSK